MPVRRILVVDDSPLVLQIMGDLLSPIPDLEAVKVSSGPAALEKLLGPGGWDLVFLDIEMPGMSGIEVLETLRARGWDAATVIAFSGDTSAQILDQLKTLGVQTLLTKPVEAETLYNLVGRPPQASRTGPPVPERWPPSLDYASVMPRFNHDQALFDRAMVRFLAEYGVWADRKSLDEGFSDPKELRFFLHTLKGVVGYLGSHAIVQAVEDLQKDIAGGGPWDPRGTKLLMALGKFCQEGFRYLEPGTKPPPAVQPPSVAAVAKAPFLAKVFALVSRHDSSVLDLEWPRTTPPLTETETSTLEEIRTLIREYEFERALPLAEKLTGASKKP